MKRPTGVAFQLMLGMPIAGCVASFLSISLYLASPSPLLKRLAPLRTGLQATRRESQANVGN